MDEDAQRSYILLLDMVLENHDEVIHQSISAETWIMDKEGAFCSWANWGNDPCTRKCQKVPVFKGISPAIVQNRPHQKDGGKPIKSGMFTTYQLVHRSIRKSSHRETRSWQISLDWKSEEVKPHGFPLGFPSVKVMGGFLVKVFLFHQSVGGSAWGFFRNWMDQQKSCSESMAFKVMDQQWENSWYSLVFQKIHGSQNKKIPFGI